MATAVDKALNIIENIAHTLKKTHINLKKCPKARLTHNYIESRLKCVEDYWSEYKQAHGELIRNLLREKRDQVPYLEREEFYEHEEVYINLVTDLKDLLVSQPVCASASLPLPKDMQQPRVILPKIQLPTFSGHYEEWLSFHDLFRTLVHENVSLNNVEKLHYLKTSLTGEASSILKQVQVTDSNYDQAWSILKTRYGNKRINVNSIMKRFFCQKKMTVNNSNLIKNLLDTTFECLHQLKNMKINIENWDPLIIFIIVQKLDPETHKDWEQHVSNNIQEPDDLPSLDMFQKFLESKFRTLELTEPTKQKSNSPSSFNIREKSFHATTSEEQIKTCQMCRDNHSLSHCKDFGKQTQMQRSEFIKQNNLCFNCLASGHSVRYCRVPTCCRICRRRHHSLLHENKESDITQRDAAGNKEREQTKQPAVALNANMKKVEETEDDITMVSSHATTKQGGTALLATASVIVRSEDSHTIILRALIDQGSQASFISERAVQQLKAKRYPIKGTVVGVGSTREDIKQMVQISVESRCEAFDMKVRTYVLSKPLITRIPSRTINTNNWPHLEKLVLADENYYQPGSIDLLLGVDIYAQIIQDRVIRGPPGSPCAHKTSLGWILFGKVEDTTQPTETVHVMHHQVMGDDLLKALWEIEPDGQRSQTREERQCEEFYEKNHRRNNKGQYVVKLPFRTNEPMSPNGNTREIAMKRLIQQENRLQKSPELREEYDKVLEEYLSMGHMEQVPEKELNNPSVYLPHHAVIRRDKETTKLRVVFDASSKGNNGVSLNDELMIGPVLQEDMRSIIMRWRMHKVCFASDVTKMYRMVLMDKNDTDYHRVLWRGRVETNSQRNCQSAEIKDYRLKTVTFGTASAPYLAIKTLIKLAEDEGVQYPDAAKIIREDFYVDDLISGCDTVEQAICVSKQITDILKRGGFELQKWASNDTNFLKCMEINKITTKANLNLKLEGTIKALGLSWDLGSDEFYYQLRLEPISPKITKRIILSELQKLFDPLGWIAPVIVSVKILVQRLWLEGLGWDQEISDEMKQEWMFIRRELENVKDIRIRRWLKTINSEKHATTLHGFCDASEKAYAAVVYCRVQTKDDTVINLIASRTRVAPVKTISLPRLELCGATLLAKLLTKVSQAMRIPSHNVFAWTDSTIVLAWLFGEPNRWKPFVANRVVEILEQTSSTQWFHVQSAHNPADVASRGTSMSELQQNKLWWNGPTWLIEEHIEYTRPPTSSIDLERKNNIQSHLNIIEGEKKQIQFEQYASLTELLRVIVHCRRFLNYNKVSSKIGQTMTAEEIQEALEVCIKRVQDEEFSNEIKRINENKNVCASSNLKSLNPFLDKQNILRVGGRLRNSVVSESQKHPIILGKKNSLVPLVVADAHLKTMHGGINMMITYLMSKYWIVGCKSLVKKYTHGCLTCARQRAASRQQIMGDLPASRVTPSRTFARSGVDFAGPVYVLNSKGRGAKTSKAYICIFICMAVKAIHLELVSDLTSDAFIAAFKRFVARRGRCKEIWSDNGTNFVASNKELHTMWKEAGLQIPEHVADQLANDGTQWQFTPPYSPNFGGLWEAGVKSVKQHLRKVLTMNCTFEEFATVLTQIEACLNSRPLTPVPTDVDSIDDIQVLTPGHFLVGESLITVPDRDYTTANVNLRSRWHHTQRLVQGFWQRWQTEYLSRLNQRPKWLKRTPEFEIGDIVLIKNEHMPPSKWALARIIEKHPGSDGITRVYTVRYNGKITRRSSANLCALPISSED